MGKGKYEYTARIEVEGSKPYVLQVMADNASQAKQIVRKGFPLMRKAWWGHNETTIKKIQVGNRRIPYETTEPGYINTKKRK